MAGLGEPTRPAKLGPVSLCLVVSSGACIASNLVEPPPEQGLLSLLWVVKTGANAVAVIALGRADEGEPFDYPSLEASGTQEITVLGYRCPLELLGLSAGAQSLAPTPSGRVLVPPPNAIWQGSFQGEEASSWIALASLPPPVIDSLGRLRVPEDRVCKLYGVSFEAERLQRLSEFQPRFILPYPPDRALTVTEDEAWVISADGQVRAMPLATTHAGTPTRSPAGAGLFSEDGELWVFDSKGRSAHGTPESGLVLHGARGVRSVHEDIRVAGGGRGSSFEVYSGKNQLVEHFDGEKWRTIRETTDATSNASPQLVRPAASELIAVGVEPENILVFRDGRPSRERLPDLPSGMGTGELPGGALASPSLGLLVGSEVFDGSAPVAGYLFRRSDDETWVRVPNSRVSGVIRLLAMLDEVVLGAGRGQGEQIAFYHPAAGGCGQEQFTDDIRDMMPLVPGRALLLDDDGLMWLLVRTAQPDPCLAGGQ